MDAYDLDSYEPPSSARSRSSKSAYLDEETYARSAFSASKSAQSRAASVSASARGATPRSQRQDDNREKSSRSNRRNIKAKAKAQQSFVSSLSWRLDPDDSLSDWTIIVLSSDGHGKWKDKTGKGDGDSKEDSDTLDDSDSDSQDTADIKYYHVHKTQLGVGPRRSEYFARLFRSKRGGGGGDDEEENVSRIELKPTAADAFPAMLDFLYSPPGSPIDATTENAVALRHLATCFGIRELFTEVTSFIQKDLNVGTALTYLHEAATYSHEKLLTAAIKLCAINFANIKLSRLVQLPPALMQRIVSSPHFKCDSESFSSRIASYCRCRPGSIDRSTLIKLTHSSRMPRIAADEALYLLSLLVHLGMVPGSDFHGGGGDRAADPDSYGEPDGGGHGDGGHPLLAAASLYERCLEAAADSVRIAVEQQQVKRRSPAASKADSKDREGRKHFDIDYQTLPAQVKIDLLEKALIMNDSDPMAKYGGGDDRKSRNSPKGGATFGREDVERIRKAYEKKLASYQTKLSSKEDELARYAEELNKFQRVPNDHRNPPLLSEYTYKAEPEYDRYGDSVYGFLPPTALPRVGRPQSDGWLYREERWTEDDRRDVRNWPMFYYKAN